MQMKTLLVSGVSLSVVAVCGLALAAVIAQSRPPTIHGIAGTYIGNYQGGAETFYLRPDGSYSQQFVRRSQIIYTNSGHWRLDTYPPDTYTLEFEYLMLPVDVMKPLTVENGPTAYPSLNVSLGADGDDIVFNDDYRIVLIKQ